MKKILFALSVMMLLFQNVSADNITAEDVNVLPGKTVQLAINMNSSDRAYTAFQFELELPVGISVTEVLKSDRIPSSADYVLTWSKVDNGDANTYGFVGGDMSQARAEITGTTGTILTLTLSAAETIDVGASLQAKLKNITMQPVEGSKTYTFSDWQFAINISDPWITLDENSTTLPEASDGETEIKVKRTIKANQWNTICFPFAMTEAQVYEAFGEDVQVAEFIEYESTDDLTSINVMFDKALLAENGFMANYPYIIKTSKNITEFMVTSVIEPDEENAVAEFTNGRNGSRKEVYGTFYGTLKAGGKVPASSLFLNGGDFWYSTGQSNIKAFRGYFEFVDVLASLETAASNVKIVFRGETTGIKDITVETANDDMYDLQGRRIVNPDKGVYIKNGKKVVIK